MLDPLNRFVDRNLRRAFIKTRVIGIKLIVNGSVVCENDEYLDGALLALYFGANTNESTQRRRKITRGTKASF